MEFNTKKALDEQVVVIEIPDYLNYNISSDLRIQLKSLVEQGHVNIVFDLQKNKYIDSSGLGALVSQISSVRSFGGDIRLASPSETVMDVLNLTHLNKILKCYKSVQTAIESFKVSE